MSVNMTDTDASHLAMSVETTDKIIKSNVGKIVKNTQKMNFEPFISFPRVFPS